MATRRKQSTRTPPSGIKIKPKNRGRLRKTTGTKSGQKVPIATLKKLKRSKNPTTRKRANFALNVRTGKIGGKKR